MKLVTKYIIILSLILALPVSHTLPASNGGDKKVIEEKTFKISAGKKIFIKTDTGDIQITPWDKSEVYMKVVGNDNAADKFNYIFSQNPEEVKIEVEKKGGWSWFSNVNLKLEIKVPGNFNIEANTAAGDIKVGGIKGAISLKTSGGDIWGDRFEGNFTAKTSGGDITLFSNDAKIEVTTSGGDIDLEYTGFNKGVVLKTSGGDIYVRVPPDFNAKAELKTSGGDVDCNLTLNNVKRVSKTKIDANINNGGEDLIAITSGGDINVYKK